VLIVQWYNSGAHIRFKIVLEGNIILFKLKLFCYTYLG